MKATYFHNISMLILRGVLNGLVCRKNVMNNEIAGFGCLNSFFPNYLE